MSNFKRTYCNPLKIENYPKGYGEPSHRSLADPSVLWYEGKWYMYPSYSMAFVSEDFINWEYHKIEPCDVGWAPTVVSHNNKIYIYGRNGNLYCADNPLGPFENLGNIKFDNGEILHAETDPMIFADDDGRVYIYYTIIGEKIGEIYDISIWGTELDNRDLTRVIKAPVRIVSFDNTHKWECYGARNQNTSLGWIEGVWVIKKNGRYYLIYSGCGTTFGTYAMGAYYSDKGPLTGFKYQQKNPICNRKYGLMSGGGHGCITEGPCDTLWAFYTCPVGYSNRFERVIGMDPVIIDDNGEISVLENTDYPQWAPGVKKDPYRENDTGLLPLTYGCETFCTSSSEGRDSLYSVDESLTTWWQPQDYDDKKELTLRLDDMYNVSAVRIIWRDVGLDYKQGILPGPFKYVVEVSKDGTNWEIVVNKSDNNKDYHIDYQTFETILAKQIRLSVCGSPAGISPGVISFTAFGTLS